MGILYSSSVFSDTVSDGLADLMFSMIENDTFNNHKTYIRHVYNDWDNLVIKYSGDMLTETVLSEIVNRIADDGRFTVGHVMCICAFISDVLKLNKDKNSECLRVAQMMSCKMVQRNNTVCKLYLDFVESGACCF